jgi:hypothetical protein
VDDGYLTVEIGEPGEELGDGGEDGFTALDYVVVAAAAEDADGDETPNDDDPCPFTADDGEDADEDGLGDACDPDRDDDGAENPADVCPDDYDPFQEDDDLDGRGDLCDVCPFDPTDDLDDDGVCGLPDNCPDVWNPDQEDDDDDGMGDACSELFIDFGPNGSEVGDGYRPDNGSRFSPLRLMGWKAPVATRERSSPAPQELDTFAFSSLPRTWWAEVPNGDYTVRVTVGDASLPQGPQRVVVQDTSFIDGLYTAAGEFQDAELVVEVRTGRLEVEIGPDPAPELVQDTGNTTLDTIEAVRTGEGPEFLRSINFQPVSARPPYGFEVDSGLVFDGERGFGWSHNLPARERKLRLPQVLDTFVFTSATRTWELELPEGSYRVYFGLGDARYAQGPQNLVVEGETAVENEFTDAGTFLEASTIVFVSDGRLTLEVGGGGGKTCLAYVVVQSAEPVETAATRPPQPTTPVVRRSGREARRR